MNYVPNLGAIPTEDARRDAVHIAVAPAKASMFLNPGDHVGKVRIMTDYGEFGLCDEPIGVVDPFFKGYIEPGQMFWLFLYPCAD